MPVIKASLMILLRRIFGHVKAFRIAFWVVGVYVCLWWLTTFWMSVFQCWPISSSWVTTPGQMKNCVPNYPVRDEDLLVATIVRLTLQDMVFLGRLIERCE